MLIVMLNYHIVMEKLWAEITCLRIWGNLGVILIFKASFITVVIASCFSWMCISFLFVSTFCYRGYVDISTCSCYLYILFFKNTILFNRLPCSFFSVSFSYSHKIKVALFSSFFVPLSFLNCVFPKFFR